jgi:hypothetical protein
MFPGDKVAHRQRPGMGVTTLWSPQQIPCRGPLSVSDFVAWEHVMVAYPRESLTGELAVYFPVAGFAIGHHHMFPGDKVAHRAEFLHLSHAADHPAALRHRPPGAGAALAGAVCPISQFSAGSCARRL